MRNIILRTMSKIYFASDFHLGLDLAQSSKEREQQIVAWLQMIRKDASEIYLVGDLFEFWFEYHTVVPKGFTRFLGTLADISDQGIKLHLFTGNHDMWMFSYLSEELNAEIHTAPIYRTINGKEFLIGHGDGLGPGDLGYKFIKGVFANKLSQWLFARLHPNFAFTLAHFWSGKSRAAAQHKDSYQGKSSERLLTYCNQVIQTKKIDYFLFGHRHLPMDFLLDNQHSRYINLGDWMFHRSYAIFDGEQLELKFYQNQSGKIIRN